MDNLEYLNDLLLLDAPALRAVTPRPPSVPSLFPAARAEVSVSTKREHKM